MSHPQILAIAFMTISFLLPPAPLLADSDRLTELRTGWRMISARNVPLGAEVISQPTYDASNWYSIAQMPSTVLQTLEDNGVYTDLYFGMNLTAKVPQDLWKQDWWYRTTFVVPPGSEVYSLIFKGINYRADIWLNGHQIADRSHAVGMYNSFEFDVTQYMNQGGTNTLAVEVAPEQALPDVNGVELADSWLDWINWKYIGYHDAQKHLDISFVPDRNAGVWKRVFLSRTGKIAIRNPYVASDLPLPATSPAALTVYCDLKNGYSGAVSGTLFGEISRPGRPAIHVLRKVTLSGNETREVAFTPEEFPQLSVSNPDLWWPAPWGRPSLYQLKLRFEIDDRVSDSQTINFGIRKVTQHRDSDDQFPKVGTGGNFYLQVNGKDFLIRGAVYTPDLLYKNDSNRDRAIMSYVKDLGLNMLRWEAKIADDTMVDLADQEGIPVMLGWMCCAQWEKWDQWSAEDHRVARESLRAQLRTLRHHASAFIWANGSDGLPPAPVLDDYRRILRELHWQNAVVDTASDFKKDAHGNTLWSGIHMEGPYSWRPPSYWFSGQYVAPRGSCAEQGDNEGIPPFESLRKFIPADKLWPINEYWTYHAGANPGNATLETIQKAVNTRYGPARSAAEFARKAQLADYENTRAQFEGFAAGGWSNHKMTLYWMLNSPWPSFFGHLFDYYLKPGGAYFGAKKGLRPVNVVFDYYATGDRRSAKIYVVNQTLEARSGLKVAVNFYNLDGAGKYSQEITDFSIGPNRSAQVMTIPRVAALSSTYFVRCQLKDGSGALLADNFYWQSTTDDDLGNPRNDKPFLLNQASWADYSALDAMPAAEVTVSGNVATAGGEAAVTITLSNNSDHMAFFLRTEVTKGTNGEEILPITYDDNYLTLLPQESRSIHAKFKMADMAGQHPGLRLEGYNLSKRIVPLN